MEPKVKHLTEHMIEILKKAKDHTTLIKMWVELQLGNWPKVLPDIKGGATQKNIAAVGAWIIKKVTRYACSKYWNCEHLKNMTEKEFDSFWAKTYNKAQTPRLAAGVKQKPVKVEEPKRVSEPVVPPKTAAEPQPAKKKAKKKKSKKKG